MSRVAHHGRDTAYHRFDRGGDGPTVCFVHGSGGNAGIWTAQARLRDRFPVVALDLSGHGESDDVATPAGPATLDAYADDVVAVAEATDADVLCGNSLGGAVALWVALERDLALDGLVLAGTGAKLTVGRELLAALATDFDRAVSLVHEPDRLFHDATPRVLERSRATMADCGRAVTERDFLTCHRFDVRDRLGEVSVPTLAVVGERDTLTPPAYHKFLADRIPNGEYAAVDDAAHLAMLETPDGFGSTVAGFLDRLG
ncbi:alpha/beta hydrolase [Halorubrum sp. 48-1-W]|uniref:alpha/beta fold hydrolase n=1 Tax=Halorubrum sp. 48-1-W TaxID=2249761 RepID=UPI000DCC29F1|nr:alpha/beta fold hydrolase [Halorubrum sp. 48-1-W]RAW47143.1 alpha/beta hydrolase [Halorubrum sp. 48-1-W]